MEQKISSATGLIVGLSLAVSFGLSASFFGSSIGFADDPPPVGNPGASPGVRSEPSPTTVQERTVSLTQAVHFTDAKGQDVVLGPGSYRVEAEDINRIRLVPTKTGESVVIDAVTFTHHQTVESPVPLTVPDPENPDVLHLALLFPVGTGLEAIGTYSGVKPRAVKNLGAVVATTGTVAIMSTPAQAPLAALPPVVQLAPDTSLPNIVIYENPNFGGRSRTLGLGGYTLSDFNDIASSIKVPTGLVALLYEHVDAGGGYGLSVDLLEDRPDLSQVNFNDKLSYVCVFSSPDPQGFVWARASVQNGQFVAGHWERQRVGGTPVNSTAVVAPSLSPHLASAPPASCGGGPIVRDHRQFARLQNYWKVDQYVNIEGGALRVSAIQPGWQSAQWTLEPVVSGSAAVRICNALKPDQCLNIESGALRASVIQPGWLSAQWTLEPVAGSSSLKRIRNVWKPAQYVNIESGAVAAGAVQPGWLSAQWTLNPLVRFNDVGIDTDGDGLADQFEEALGTCASNRGSIIGVNCNQIADPRDSDGDGLQDGWEVLGKWTSNSQNNPVFLDLPRWGADPRHKDVFIEVDFRRLNLDENQQGLALHMPPEAARQMAAMYADAATTDPGLRAAHAASIANPDGLPGIRLHLDIGIPPERPEEATIYGDWGGYNPVDALPDGPQRPEQVWPVQMDRSRHGVFHYVMGYTTGGGSCGGGIACGFNMAFAPNAAHEFGHTMGLDHNGPYSVADEPNCKPNYMSLMSYSYYPGYKQFSDGRRKSLQFNNHSLRETNVVNPSDQPLLDSLVNTFGYKVDLPTGHVDWNRDGIFSPVNVRVRAYANYKPYGQCEFTRQGEQDAGIQSHHSPAVVRYNNAIWMFVIDLNGQLAYSRTGAWNCSPNIDSCPIPKFTPSGTRDLGPVSAIDAKTVKVNGTEMIILVGIRPDGSIFYTWLTAVNNFSVLWNAVLAIDGSSPASGEPSLANSRNQSSLMLAYKGTDNVVRVRSFTGNGWSAEQLVVAGGQPVAVHPNTSPALAFVYLPLGMVFGQEYLIGAFTDPQARIQLYAPQLPGPRWGRIPIPYDELPSSVGRPVMAWTPGPGDGGAMTTLGAIAPTSTLSAGTVPATGSASPLQPLTVAAATTKPGTVAPNATLVPESGTTLLSTGRFYILFLEYQVPPPGYPATNATRMAMSYVGPDGKLRIGLNSYFDNVWSYVYGMSLVTPSEAALRAAMTYSIHKPAAENHVFFRPHADGMADLTYNDYDDWKTLGWGSCVTVAKTQTSSPVKCAPAW